MSAIWVISANAPLVFVVPGTGINHTPPIGGRSTTAGSRSPPILRGLRWICIGIQLEQRGSLVSARVRFVRREAPRWPSGIFGGVMRQTVRMWWGGKPNVDCEPQHNGSANGRQSDRKFVNGTGATDHAGPVRHQSNSHSRGRRNN